MKKLLSTVLIFLGLLFFTLAGFLFWQRNNPRNLSFNLPENTLTAPTVNPNHKPVQILIKDLNINLPIYPGAKSGNRWESTNKGISYLTSSPLPGEEGNSILYGHNWRSLLGNLTKARPDQEIQIVFDDETTRTFTIENTAIVTPGQTSVLDQTKDKRITLYTCTGFLDQKRFVVLALSKEK